MKRQLIAKRHSGQQLLDLSAFSGAGHDDLINLSLGDPDFHTPKSIISAAFRDAEMGHTHYTDGLGQLELRQAVCDDLAAFNMDVDLAQCMITTSACHAMWLTLEAILDDGDEVVVFSPFFSPYADQIKLARGVMVDCPANEDFTLNAEQLVGCITEKTKAIILNSPNNPTGCCYSEENLKQIADVAIQHDLLVIADDIYTAFCYQGQHIAIASLPDMAERTVTLGSFSKNYCMTGWRIGYVIAPPALVSVMEGINQSVIFSPPSISQRAALYAMTHKADFQPEIVSEIRNRALFAHEQLNSFAAIRCLSPAGGMYVFPNISETGLDAKVFSERLLNEAQIKVIPGDAFGVAGAGHVRIALTVSIPVLEKAFERMRSLTWLS